MIDPIIHRILIVDDEEIYGKLVREMLLNRTSFQCDTSPAASDALNMLQQNEYQLVISDIRMPGIDGLEFMRAAKQEYPELDFIIMTAHAGDYEFSDIIGAGATDFISKPFGWSELKAKIERIEKEKRVFLYLRSANLELSGSFDRLQGILEDSINALVSALEMKDLYTAGHQQRVSDIACRIAGKIGLPDERIKGIRLAGLVHDIGKISVPSEILSKPSKLNELEFGLIKRHAITGFEILKRIQFTWPIADIVLQHHERMNGSGYPQSISGNDMLLEARIMAVADVVEAMSSHRPYRPSLGIGNAIEEISENSGILYDPLVVDACLELEWSGAPSLVLLR